MISDNGVDYALLILAAMHVGRPSCKVLSAYSRLGPNFSRIPGILHKLRPALVYASDGAVDVSAPLVLGKGHEQSPGAIAFGQLRATAETPAVLRAFKAIASEDNAKYLLTSGSTGSPKVVINTHRMPCANQQMIAQA